MKKWQANLFGTAAALVTGGTPFVYFEGLPADLDIFPISILTAGMIGLGVAGWLEEQKQDLRRFWLVATSASTFMYVGLVANWNTPPSEIKPEFVCPIGAREPMPGEQPLPNTEGFVPPCVNQEGKIWPPPDWPAINCPKNYVPGRRLLFHDYEVVPACRLRSSPIAGFGM
jgi:hypothetical protein